MPKTVVQSVSFNVSPDQLFELYADSRKHSAAIGSKAQVSRRAGGTFSAFGRMIKGKTLTVIPKKMFVQTWRGSEWKRGDEDSVLMLMFGKKGRGSTLTMVHANVPESHFASIKDGWNKYYWKPWRAYLSRKK